MTIEKEFELFSAKMNLRIELAKSLIEYIQELSESLKPFEGKVINKRIEKYVPNTENFNVHYEKTFIHSIYIKPKLSGKYDKSYLPNVIHISLCGEKHLSLTETKQNFSETIEQLNNDICRSQKAISDFIQCRTEYLAMEKSYRDWTNKYDLSKNGTYAIFYNFFDYGE